MSVHKVATSGNTVSSTMSVNTENIHDGLCRQLMIYSASSDTVYDANIIDDKNRTVREFFDITFKINDLTTFPVSGIYTIEVTNSSADELFTAYMGIQEG